MTDRTNSPSQDARGTARLPNPSTTLSKEVEEVVAALNDFLSFETPDAKALTDAQAKVNAVSVIAIGHTRARRAIDLLTRISAERDEIAQALAFRGNATSDKDRLSWCVAIAIDTFRAAAERAEAERDALKAPPEDVLERMARAFLKGWGSGPVFCDEEIDTMISAMRSALAAAEERCQCDACRSGPPHASDCAVHRAPAFPIGPCDCGAASIPTTSGGR